MKDIVLFIISVILSATLITLLVLCPFNEFIATVMLMLVLATAVLLPILAVAIPIFLILQGIFGENK